MSTTPQIKTWRPWLVFAGCCVLSFIGFGLIVNTQGLYFTALSEEFGVGRSQVALPLSIEQITAAITMLFAGALLKKIDSRIIISICIVLSGGVFILGSTFTAIWQFDVAFAILGAAYVIPIALTPAVLLSNWFQKKLGTVMGIGMGISGIGGAIFNPVVSNLITTQGWRTAYLITGIAVLVCILPFSIFALKFAPNPAKGELPYGYEAQADNDATTAATAQGIDAKKAFLTRTFIFLSVAIIIQQFSNSLLQHISAHEVQYGFTLSQGALVMTGTLLGAAAGKMLIGILLDHLRPAIVISIFTCVGILGWGGLLFSHMQVTSIAAGLFAGIGQGFVLVGIPWIIRNSFGPKDYSTILFIISMFGSFANAALTTLHGTLFDATGSYVTSISGGIVIYVLAAALVIAAYAGRPYRDNNAIADSKQ